MLNRNSLIFLTIVAFLAVFVMDVSFSNGRRLGRSGGRSFSRSGVASRGSFSGRRFQRPQRQYRPPVNRVNRQVRVAPRSQGRPVAQRPQQYQRPQNIQRQNRAWGGSNRMASGTQKSISPENRQRLAQNRKGAIQDRMAQNKGNLEDRQEWRDKNREDIQKEIRERQEKRQEFIKDRQEDRQDFIEDIHDDHHHHHHWDDHWDGDGGEFAAGVIVGGVVVGAAAAAANANNQYDQPQVVYNNTTTYVTTLPCHPREVQINGVTYFNCGSEWYQRSYAGSQVTFIPVSPPPGY